MKWMKPVFDITFSKGKWGGLKQCWHNIRRGGYFIMLDYKEQRGEGGVQESGKWLRNK